MNGPSASLQHGRKHRSRKKTQDPENPILLVEVLSPSTESYDRGQKFAFYRSTPSLQEYVLISQRQKLVEIFRKNEEGLWVLRESDAERGVVALGALGVTVRLDDLYANITLEDVSLR